MLAGKKMPPSSFSSPWKLHCWTMVLSTEGGIGSCTQPVCSAPACVCTVKLPFISSFCHVSRIVTTATFVCYSWAGEQAKYPAHRIFWFCIVLICFVWLCLGDLAIKIWPFIPADLFFRMLSHMGRLSPVLAHGSHVVPVNLQLPKKPLPRWYADSQGTEIFLREYLAILSNICQKNCWQIPVGKFQLYLFWFFKSCSNENYLPSLRFFSQPLFSLFCPHFRQRRSPHFGQYCPHFRQSRSL